MSGPPPYEDEADFYRDEEQGRDFSHPYTQHHAIPSGRAYHFFQSDGMRGRDVTITPVNRPDQIAYTSHANVAILNSKPTLEVTSHGRLVAAVYHHWSSGIKIGVDPQGTDSESGLRWIEVKKNGYTALDKSFSFESRGQRFVLARMSASNAGATGSGNFLRHYKVIEEASGNTIATYVTESLGNRHGTLTLSPGVGPELELYAMSSILMWREMGRRQQRTVGAF